MTSCELLCWYNSKGAGNVSLALNSRVHATQTRPEDAIYQSCGSPQSRRDGYTLGTIRPECNRPGRAAPRHIPVSDEVST